MSRPADKSFFEMYDQHHAVVHRFVAGVVRNGFTADDIVQEAFVRAYHKRGTLKDPAKTRQWIMRIAYNLCLDHFRSRQTRKTPALTPDVETFSCGGTGVEGALARREMSDCVQAQMQRLPESQRSVLILFDVLGFSHREVADILETTVGNVKVRLHRARKAFKAILQQNCRFEHDDRNVFVCLPLSSPTGQPGTD